MTISANYKDVKVDTDAVYHLLAVISQENYGYEFFLTHDTATIGSSEENTIRISENRVSDFHAIIRMDEEGCHIDDLKSRKGTYVNGKKIFGEKFLRHNDTIQIGFTIFKFIAYGQAVNKSSVSHVKPHESAAKDKKKYKIPEALKTLFGRINNNQIQLQKRKPLLIFLIIFCSIMVTIALLKPGGNNPKKVAAKISDGKANTQIPSMPIKTPLETTPKKNETVAPPPEKDDTTKMALVYFTTGKAFMENQLWTEAIENLEKAEELSTADLQKQIRMTTEQALMERENRMQLEKGVRLVEEKKYADAIELLKKIPSESVYRPKSESILEEATEQIEIAKIKAQKAKSRSHAYEKGVIRETVRFYNRGDIDGAIQSIAVLSGPECKSSYYRKRAAILRQQMTSVKNNYESGLSLYEKKQIESAFSKWSEAISVEKNILGKSNGFFERKIAQLKANYYYLEARNAWSIENYTTAYKYIQNALSYNKNFKDALELKNKIYKKGEEFFKDAYVLEVYYPKKARKIWKLILSMCDPDTKLYKKSDKRLAISLRAQ